MDESEILEIGKFGALLDELIFAQTDGRYSDRVYIRTKLVRAYCAAIASQNRTPQHASDCALHNGPAYEPRPCDCGANPGEQPDSKRHEYPPNSFEAKARGE